jgi:glyoxylase-like metal-dependent hydrolase (beta-lactamase superfamily II)
MNTLEDATTEVSRHSETVPLTRDLAYLRTAIANVFLYGSPGAGDRGWVLIDSGMPGYAGSIRDAADAWFGAGARPAAIILTHGHFDHVGTVRELAEAWDCPVFAHQLELPYLTGRSAYPPPDPSVGGGAMARMAWAYPKQPIDLGRRVHALPAACSVPFMDGWRWIHTPGHTAGHVSLFREYDATLIVGDAFVTVRQESASAVLTQRPEVHGPPSYYTSDWRLAEASVRRLALQRPQLVATGHGVPLEGPAMRAALDRLARDFQALAVPDHGRYVGRPAIADEGGVRYVPPRNGGRLGTGTLLLAGLAGFAAVRLSRRR